MTRKRNIGTVAALGGFAAAAALLSGVSAAGADELSELRANQQLLQQRLDQLAQAVPGAPPGPGGPVMTGSFPRSFVIPGTEVSLRIGGQGVGSVVWYMKGAAVGGALNGQGSFNETFTDGQGGTGNLPSIPLKQEPIAANAVGYAHSRSATWDFSGKQSRIFLDARTPSPFGEVKAYIEFDFAASNTNTILNNNQGSVNGYIPRLRQGYATLGPLLMGQTNGTFTDTDSEPELLDFGGSTGAPFVSRTPQLRITYPLPAGMSIAVAAENPNPNAAGPFGTYFTDTNQIPNAQSCTALTQTAVTTVGPPAVAAATNITNACLGNAAFFNALQDLYPTFVARGRIDQPWGHLQVGLTTVGYALNDGRYLNRSYIGYGGSISGHFVTWGKDNLTFGVAGGDGIGDQISNNIGLATNFGGALLGQTFTAVDSRSAFSTNRQGYDAAVLARTIKSFSARIGYQHWWTPELRSTVDFSMNHNDVPFFVFAGNAGRPGGFTSVNKELTLAHANLIWSPVAFVDIGVEGAWGHRVVVSNLKGDAYTLQTSLKFRF
jgi:hypothetical protein